MILQRHCKSYMILIRTDFTMEKENLPSLDCIISFNEKREIITRVYRKPTQTGQHTHFSSNQSLHVVKRKL